MVSSPTINNLAQLIWLNDAELFKNIKLLIYLLKSLVKHAKIRSFREIYIPARRRSGANVAKLLSHLHRRWSNILSTLALMLDEVFYSLDVILRSR